MLIRPASPATEHADMSKVSSRRAAVCAVSSFGLALALAGCKCSKTSESGSAQAPSATPSALPPEEEPSACRQRPGLSLLLSADAAPPAPSEPGEAGDDEALLPFGVELGAALPIPSGFAIAGIRGASQPFVSLLREQGSRRVDLGELHGEAETPALAASAESVLVALRSTDAAGFTIKLGKIVGAGGIEWGFELSKLGKSVAGLELAANGKRAVLAYQKDEKTLSKLMLGAFDSDSLKEPFEVKALDLKDAEMPRVVPRAGGFWLSWVSVLGDAKLALPATEAAEDPEERDLLEVGLRVIEVAKLDEQGRLQGQPLRVGEPRRQLLLFDVAALASGGLLIAARSDSAAPGAEGGAIVLSEVTPDGTVHDERLDDEELGTGAPVLLMDGNERFPGPWLAVSAPNDTTRVGLVRGARTVLHADPLLRNAEVLAVGDGSFLTQRARGRAAELRALSCSWPNDASPQK
jgi:hypothetical protein